MRATPESQEATAKLDRPERDGLVRIKLSDALIEVSAGVGADWAAYPVIGATRAGIAPAKEPVGKQPERYKLVTPGTIFYNPMRILLGSIAMVDVGQEPGITSPDYVVFRTREGLLHHRWFYYWLRSPFGADLIQSLARGAVRERLLFRRMAVAEINVPPWPEQQRAAKQLLAVERVRAGLLAQVAAIDQLPTSLMREALSGQV